MTLEEFNSMLPLEQRKLAVLNQSQVASLLGLSNSTLANWRAEGISLEYLKVGKGKRNRVLYLKTKLVEFLNSNQIKVS
ncbi:helix-turn-helix domain-containing protein [Aliarcobacter butzleri]|uniref:helix-turn-helix domain-containing protein n=1 Tax=Aliarcobacter butzleri TaxID=28197 RepID=UPI003AE1C5FA